MQQVQMRLQAEVMLFVKSKSKRRVSRRAENFSLLISREVSELETVKKMTRREGLKELRLTSLFLD